MCEYCNKRVNNKQIIDIDNDKEDFIELRQVMMEELTYTLYVELDGEDIDGYKPFDYFRINFCPMCGRSLRGAYNMSKADEMFEELGYIKDDTGNELIYQKNNHEICFYLNRQNFDCGCGIGREFITMQELEAINEKCRELGWIGGEDE